MTCVTTMSGGGRWIGLICRRRGHVGAGLPAMTACQPTPVYLKPQRSNCGSGLAREGGLAVDACLPDTPGSNCGSWLACDDGLQSTQLDRVHIRYLGNGHLGFRSDSGSLLKSAKVSKTLLPHHSAPRLGSVCPHSGLNPWAAVMGHPWPRTANPASCRVTHEFKPAFGQRGLTGRLRSRSKAEQRQDQERLASHRGYRWLLQPYSGGGRGA